MKHNSNYRFPVMAYNAWIAVIRSPDSLEHYKLFPVKGFGVSSVGVRSPVFVSGSVSLACASRIALGVAASTDALRFFFSTCILLTFSLSSINRQLLTS